MVVIKLENYSSIEQRQYHCGKEFQQLCVIFIVLVFLILLRILLIVVHAEITLDFSLLISVLKIKLLRNHRSHLIGWVFLGLGHPKQRQEMTDKEALLKNSEFLETPLLTFPKLILKCKENRKLCQVQLMDEFFMMLMVTGLELRNPVK